MRLAIFRRLGEHSSTSACEEWADGCDAYVRLSEFVDVNFPPLKGDDVVQKQLNALDRTESALRDKFQSALNGIEHQRAELRAITHKA